MKSLFNIKLTFSGFDGLIARLALVMERRGYTIEELKVHRYTDEFSCIDLVIQGDPVRFEQVKNQLNKLIDIVSVDIVETERIGEHAVVAA